MDPYIKLCRKITEWEWYRDTNTKTVFIHLLIIANHKQSRWQGIEINRGECVTSLDALSNALNLSKQQVRTALDKLKSTHEINTESTHRFTVIKIVNYERYQGSENSMQHTDNTVITQSQHSDNTVVTPLKELKNLRNIYNNYINNTDFAKAIKLYEQNIGVPSPIVRETIIDILSSHNADLMELAIEEAVKANARNIKYIEGIFRNWDDAGVKTVEDAMLAIAEHRCKSDAVPKQSAVSAKPRKNSFQNYDNEVSDFEIDLIRRRMGENL